MMRQVPSRQRQRLAIGASAALCSFFILSTQGLFVHGVRRRRRVVRIGPSALLTAESSQLHSMRLRDFEEPLLVQGVFGVGHANDGAGGGFAHLAPEQLARHLGDIEVQLMDAVVTAIFGPEFLSEQGVARGSQRLSEYLQEISEHTERQQLFTSTAGNPTLFDRLAPMIPDPGWSVFSEGKYGHVVSIGPGGAGLPFHAHGFAWLAQAHGSKRFYLLPPDFQLGGWPRDVYREAFLRSPSDWSEATRAAVRSSGFETTLRPGDAIAIPAFWYHATENVGASVAVGGQLFGHTLRSNWSEEEEELRYGPTESARSLSNLGLIRCNLAGFFESEGRGDDAERSMRLALRHFGRARELHPLNYYIAMKEMVEAARWAGTPADHSFVGERLRALVSDMRKASREGLLSGEVAAFAIAYSVAKYAKVYLQAGPAHMAVPRPELQAALVECEEVLASSPAACAGVDPQCCQEFLTASMEFLGAFHSIRRLFATPWP